jgi:transposase
MSCRAAAAHFDVSISSAIRWRRLALRDGRAVAKPRGGDRHSGRIEAHGDFIKELLAEQGDITLTEIQARLTEPVCRRASAPCIASWRGTGSRAKKTGHAVEQDRPDVLRQRERWFDGQLDLDPVRLVFIDETWTATNMTRSHGRCPRGERLRMGFPHVHRKTTTPVAGLRMIGMVAPMVLDGAINGDWFEAYVTKVLLPELWPGDIVIMDNFSSHKRVAVKEKIEAAGATLRFPPPYSPDFNPIEKAFSRLKPKLNSVFDKKIVYQ